MRGCTTLHYESVRKRGSAVSTVRASLVVCNRDIFRTCRYEFSGEGCLCDQDQQLREALLRYRHLSIDEILNSRDEYILALGMLDARVSRQRLAKIDLTCRSWMVRQVLDARLAAESMGNYSVRKIETTESRQVAKIERDDRLKNVLRRHKRRKDVSAFLDEVQDGTNVRFIDSKLSRVMEKYVKGKNKGLDRPRYVRALKSLADNSKLVNEQYLRGLLELIRDEPDQVRSLDSWQPRTYNADRQFSSLARHLFAKYDVPLFMDRAWFSGNRLHQTWFKHIGSGGNMRTAPNLPVPLTKMMAHHFLSAHPEYTIERALRRAQALGLGTDERIAAAIAESRLAQEFKDNDFWLSVIGFFARNPMLDSMHVGPIIDFIWNQKYEDVLVVVGRGVTENRGPAQPNFTMKGRTVTALLQQVERWHKNLGKGFGGDLKWARCSIAEFEYVEGSADKNNLRIWRIAELLSSCDLVTEGRELNHCVASYARSCFGGTTSIWSLTLQEQGGPRKLITIEVDIKKKKVYQVRGQHNRYPSNKEQEIVQRWATQVGISYN